MPLSEANNSNDSLELERDQHWKKKELFADLEHKAVAAEKSEWSNTTAYDKRWYSDYGFQDQEDVRQQVLIG